MHEVGTPMVSSLYISEPENQKSIMYKRKQVLGVDGP